ncbi:MAG: LLM class F420-dependent oxidoreductase [Chloroflexi bacterium]|nr:LLM class F420-dependent oxidoreductase [Chloroflexota bacterium]
MKIGVLFPQTEIGTDPGAIRAYAETAEAIGIDYILFYEHILGADVASHQPWKGVYDARHMFHEPFVTFGFMAAVTKRIELVTGVVVTPLRQTALLAKQAAEADVLSNGRVRLGIGVGWNHVEYEALGVDVHKRGAIQEEQIEVLRHLWTKPIVTFMGRFHTITAAGLNPMPVQRPIPIWMGAYSERALRRAGRLADGLIPAGPGLTDHIKGVVTAFRKHAKEAGRDPAKLGVDASVVLAKSSIEQCAAQAAEWKAFGATHVRINTMDAGVTGAQGHIEAMRKWREALRQRGI